MLDLLFLVEAEDFFRGDKRFIIGFGRYICLKEFTFSSTATLGWSVCDHFAHDEESLTDALSFTLLLLWMAVEDFVEIIATC
jgi:hypothetical protein